MRSSISTPRKKSVTGRLFVFVDSLGELNGAEFCKLVHHSFMPSLICSKYEGTAIPLSI